MEYVDSELVDVLVELVVRPGVTTRERLSMTALGMLSILASAGPRRITTLAADLRSTQPAITGLAIRLERDGYVQRQPDPADGRAVLVAITELGREHLGQRRSAIRAEIADQLAALKPPDLAALSAARPALEALLVVTKNRKPNT